MEGEQQLQQHANISASNRQLLQHHSTAAARRSNGCEACRSDATACAAAVRRWAGVCYTTAACS
jgi:hypothetical protein